MNLPNTLTILRIFFVPFLVAVLVEQDLRIDWHGAVLVTNEFLALAIFLVGRGHRSCWTDTWPGAGGRSPRWGRCSIPSPTSC